MHPRPPTPSDGPPPSGPDAHPEALLDELSAIELEALRWSVRASDGLAPAARAELQAWLQAAPAHRAAFEDMAGVLDAVDEIPAVGTARLRATVAIDNAQASSATGARTPPLPAADPAPRHSRRLFPLALAALVALAMLGGGWFGRDQRQRQPVFSQQFATQRGQQLQAPLPDGSHLQMDTATQADVTFYRQRREVLLSEGQVVFQVKADQDRPFDVLAGATRVTVLGTRFLVRYTPSMGSRAVQVAVMEGRVRVAIAQGEHSAPTRVDLLPGQVVSADAQGRLGTVERMATASMAPWLDQRLNFDNVALSSVLAELGRYGKQTVRVASPAIGALPVTAGVDLRNIAGFVQSLPHVLPVRLREHDGATEIVAR
ncbi:FecR domain-containing protein [Pseudorhodoferax sp. LjRoot39]|uniref:FecR family protein n=1 Tax=Pseudorhodoferax sp. LjRoot39 TaxID=3342328 RepID=UPI003ED09718